MSITDTRPCCATGEMEATTWRWGFRYLYRVDLSPVTRPNEEIAS
jgi:hypothetical protein